MRTEMVMPSAASSVAIRRAEYFRGPAQLLDPDHHLGGGSGGLVVRDAGPVEQAGFAVARASG